MEVYVDDMLVKSIKDIDHIKDLTVAFEALRQRNMKLNPAKCAFEVLAEKFLGFMVSQRGIEANPEKIKALIDMNPPRCKKEIQRLTGRVVALGRFISRFVERCLPFFKSLRKVDNFTWSKDCQQAFDGLKEVLVQPPLLAKPKAREKLYLYLAATHEAVSFVLIYEDDLKVQRPMYYTNRVLHDAETRYSRTDKIIFSLITSAQRLRPYF